VVEVTAAPVTLPAQQLAQAPAAPIPPAAASRTPKLTGEPKLRRRSCLRTTLLAVVALAVIALVTIGAFVAGGALVFRGLGQAGALVVPTEFSQQATVAAAQGTVLPFRPEPRGPTATVDPDNVVAVAMINGHAACPGPACPGGDANKALAIYNTALAKQPDSADLLAARAQLYVWWDAHTYADQARADIAAALSQDEDSAAAYMARASLTAATTDSDADRATALADYNKAVDLAPDQIDARLARADFLVLTGDVYAADSPGRAQVLADSEAVLAIDPQNILALNLRGEMRYAVSQFEQSLADCNIVIGIDPQNIPALLRRGQIYRNHLNQPQKATADFAAVLAIEPDNLVARESHAAMLAMAGDYHAALADVEAMVKLAPDTDFHQTMLGFVHLGLDQPAAAQEDFNKALAISADATDARYGRGLTLLAQDKPAEAIPDLEVAVQHPDDLYYIQEIFTGGHPRAQLDLARAYMAAGRQSDAGPLLDDAVKQNEGWYLPYLVRSRYRRATGDLAGAREDLRSATSSAASDAERTEVAQEQGR
jgi:tetratricopeptide (TPR) repeat protein